MPRLGMSGGIPPFLLYAVMTSIGTNVHFHTEVVLHNRQQIAIPYTQQTRNTGSLAASQFTPEPDKEIHSEGYLNGTSFLSQQSRTPGKSMAPITVHLLTCLKWLHTNEDHNLYSGNLTLRVLMSYIYIYIQGVSKRALQL
jgi:hypothetical protein